MKKIIALLLTVLLSGPLFAQAASNMRDMREAIDLLTQKKANEKKVDHALQENQNSFLHHSDGTSTSPKHMLKVNKQKLQQAIDEAMEATHAKNKVQLPSRPSPKIKIGKHEFTITKFFKERDKDGKEVWSYFYSPANGPVVFEELVEFDSAINHQKYKVISPSNINRFIGPIHTRYVDFEVSGIEINIYEDDRFDAIVSDWENSFGKGCVGRNGSGKANWFSCTRDIGKTKEAGLLHTPTKIYALEDGRTVVVYVYASSEYGPYKQGCSTTNAGRIFSRQPELNKIIKLPAPERPYK